MKDEDLNKNYQILGSELQRLLQADFYFKAMTQLNPQGDFYGELFKLVSNGNILDLTLDETQRRDQANEAINKQVEKIIKGNFKSLE